MRNLPTTSTSVALTVTLTLSVQRLVVSPARTLLTYSGVKRSTILTSFLVKWSDTSALPRVLPVPKTGVLLTRTRVR